MESKMKQYILSKGLTLGGIVSVILFLEYIINKDLMLNTWLGVFVGYALPITYIVFMTRAYRIKHNDAYLEFREAFSVAFGIAAMMTLLYTVTTILLYNVIDPSLVDFMVEGVINTTVEMMEGFGTPEKDIKEVIKGLEKMGDGFTPLGLLKSSFWGLAIWAVFCLLIAAATKKSRPLFDDTLN